MSDSNIAVLVIAAALACGAIWLGDPPQPSVAAVAGPPTQVAVVQAQVPDHPAVATNDCVAHPARAGCGTQIVASAAADAPRLPHAADEHAVAL